MDVERLNELDQIILKDRTERNTWWFILKLLGVFLLVTTLLLFFTWNYLKNPPTEFPINEKFVIEPGTGLKQIASMSKEANLVRSKYLLLLELTLSDNQTVKAGNYTFTEPLSTAALAETFFTGNPKGDLVRLTHIEGETAESLADRASKVLPNLSVTEFINLTAKAEGQLFPDTYFIPKDFNADQLTDLLLTTFTEKTETFRENSKDHYLTWEEIIILASILEREANSEESKKMVSGILQNRLKLGMALQADATIEYVLDKPLSALAPADLEIDSPYNTYLYPGLPPTPIGNPGLSAIEAAIFPTESDYYFYITGRDGKFYYAKNFDEHRLNIARYLR